jgi:ABC-type branched-subunit amino acid transport system substrate-binding protein
MGITNFLLPLNLFQISGGAESPALSDTSVYPNFFRTTSPYTLNVVAFTELCAELGLDTVGIVEDWSTENQKTFSQPVLDAFTDAVAAKKGLRLAFSDVIQSTRTRTLEEEVDEVAHRLLHEGVRVVYVAFGGAQLYRLVCLTHQQLVQQTGPNHNGVVWLVGSDYYMPPKHMPDAQLTAAGCTREEWGLATRGILTTTVTVSSTAPPEPGGRLPAAWYEEYLRRVPMYNTTARPTTATERQYAATNYDAVWMFALALDKMLKGTATASAVPLSKLSFPDANVAGLLKTHLRGTSFDGASGRVTVESKTQDRDSSSLLIIQVSSSAKEGTRPIASYSQAGNTFETTAFNANGAAGFNITWPTMDGAPPTGLQKFSLTLPTVLGVVPRFASPFGSETLMIIGRNFHDGVLSITVGGKACISPKMLSPTRLSCITPAGEGANIAVQVTIEGISSLPSPVFAYMLPQVSAMSRAWLWHEGSVVRVRGHDFVAGQTYCRLGETGARVFAEVVDRTLLTCKVGEAAVNARSPLYLLYVSNDGGMRWVSGLYGALGAAHWFNNSLTTPVTTVSVYSEIHVGAIVFEDGSPSAADRKDGLEKGAALAELDGIFGPNVTVKVHYIDSKSKKGGGAAVVEKMESLLNAYPDMVGIVGGYFSSVTIPVAYNVSLPRRLPMIAYGAGSSVLSDSKALPYFLRASVSTINEASELNNMFNAFRWTRIGIITSTDAYALDAGNRVRDRFEDSDGGDGAKVGKVLYKGEIAEFASGAGAAEIDAAASSREADGLATHARQLKELGVQVIYFNVINAWTMRALFKAFEAAGLSSSGHAFVTSQAAQNYGDDVDRLGLPEAAEGVIDMNICSKPCAGQTCRRSKLSSYGRNAHDAMYALLRGVGVALAGSDGGEGYQANKVDDRRAAMDNIRFTSLPNTKMMSGALTFDSDSNDRAATDFLYKFDAIRRVNGTLVFAPLGELSDDKQTFKTEAGVHIVWPGNTSVLPADRDLSGIAPKVVTIAWLEQVHHSHTRVVDTRMDQYMRWSLARLNADKFLLPYTRLELRHEIVTTSGAEFTADCERVRREAKADGEPVVGFITSGTSLTKEVLKMSSPLPTVAFRSSQVIMENTTQFPWLVRVYPSDSQRADATSYMLRNYGWTKVLVLVDQASTWANSLAKGITDKSAAHGIVLESWWTPHLRDMSKLNATKLDLAAAAKHAKDKGFKVILLAMSNFVELAVRALYDEGMYGEGIVLIGSSNSYFRYTDAAFVGPERVVLDSSMVLVESGVDLSLQHSIASMAEWPEGKGAFLADTKLLNAAYSMDALQLFAHAIDATLHRAKSPLNSTELMLSLRTTTVKGLTGDVKIETGWNNIRARAFTIKQARVLPGLQNLESPGIAINKRTVALTNKHCKAAAGRQGLSKGGGGWAFAGKYTQKGCYTYTAGKFAGMAFYGTGGTDAEQSAEIHCEVTDEDLVKSNFSSTPCFRARVFVDTTPVGLRAVTVGSLVVETLGFVNTDRADLRVCQNGLPPAIGPTCGETAMPVTSVQAFGQTNASLQVNWRVNVEAGSQFARPQLVQAGYRLTLSSIIDNNDDDVVEIVPPGITHGFVVFDLDRVKANVHYRVGVTALYDGGKVEALPTNCLSPLGDSCGGSLACIPTTTGTSTCGCRDNEMHTMNLVEGVPPEAWGCRQCRTGLVCRGGTAESTVTAKGWFVGSTLGLITPEAEIKVNKIKVNATSTRIRLQPAVQLPSLLKCPRDRSCPGGFQVSKLLRAGNIEDIFAQCAEGFTGIECAACLPGYSYTSCVKCSITRDQAIEITVGVVLFLLAIALTAYALLKHASRPSKVERSFIAAFEQAENKFGIGGSLRAFEEVFECSSEDGVSQEDFVRALEPGGKLGILRTRVGSSTVSKEGAAVQRLWEKLDRDGDRELTGSEFLVYFYHLKSGTQSTNATRARLARAGEWYYSIKTQSIKMVLISYFQMLSSVPRSFPLVTGYNMQWRVEKNSTATDDGATGEGTGLLAAFKALLQPAIDLVGNFNVRVNRRHGY